MRRIATAFAIGPIVWSAVVGATNASAKEIRFVFSGSDVQVIGVRGVGMMAQDAHVRPGEEMSVPELVTRFGGPRLTLSDECEGVCAIVTVDGGYLELFYGREASRVSGIVSRDEAAADVNGNRIGTRLMDANGGSALMCDRGMDVTCTSALIEGLEYIVGGCQFKVSDGAPTTVPDCATIEGFRLWE